MRRLLASFAITGLMVLPLSAATLARDGSENQSSGQAHADQNASDNSELHRLQNLADVELVKRQNSLNALLNIVKNTKCLAQVDRDAIKAQVQAEVTAVPTLKTEIDNSTDTETEHSHADAVTNDFKTFSLIVPKVHLLRVADAGLCASARITKYADNLQTRIDTAKTAGKDTSSLETTMTDMRTKIKTANDDLAQAVHLIITTTPDQFSADHSIVTHIRDLLKSAKDSLRAAFKDGNTIKQGLVKLNAGAKSD